MKTLYLHIGTPKTATTSIQRFLEINEVMLDKAGYIYPIFQLKYPYVPLNRNGHFLVGKIYDEEGKEDLKKEKSVFYTGIRFIHEAFEKCDSVILSDENIWNVLGDSKIDRFRILRELQKDAESCHYIIKILVYLRRQDYFATSLFSQHIKTGNYKDRGYKWEKYISKQAGIVLDYYSHLERMASVVGKENIIVRVFEPSRFKGGTIYSDFLDMVGLKISPEWLIESEFLNLSISGNRQEIKRIINTCSSFDDTTRTYAKDMILACEKMKNIKENVALMSKDEKEIFFEIYAENNKKIAREYLHTEGDLFDMTIDDQKKWTPDNPYMYEDIIRYFGEVTLMQQKTIMELKSVISEISGQVNSMYRSAIFKSYRKVRKLVKNKE